MILVPFFVFDVTHTYGRESGAARYIVGSDYAHRPYGVVQALIQGMIWDRSFGEAVGTYLSLPLFSLFPAPAHRRTLHTA